MRVVREKLSDSPTLKVLKTLTFPYDAKGHNIFVAMKEVRIFLYYSLRSDDCDKEFTH